MPDRRNGHILTRHLSLRVDLCPTGTPMIEGLPVCKRPVTRCSVDDQSENKLNRDFNGI